MQEIPSICIIAGSDSIGGAGLQADLRIAALLNCSASNVVTCVTAQDLKGVHAVHYLSGTMISAQLACALSSSPRAIKIGMLGNAEIMLAIYSALKEINIPIILDPVLIATSKSPLVRKDAFSVLIEKLIPLSYLITPNLFEAQVFFGQEILDVESMQAAAQKILALGARNVLIKGLNLGNGKILDLLITHEQKFVEFWHEEIQVNTTHGTGCRFSSAIACHIAMGETLEKSISLSSALLREEILRMQSLYMVSK